MFPTAEMLGIDLVLPDFSYLRDRADDIEAIVLTHGHEDHVGALPYVLREIGMPPVIYGGPLTIGLVRSKLDEHKLRDAPLEVLDAGRAGDAWARSSWSWSTWRTRSPTRAPWSCAPSSGPLLITGDYKFDQTPVDGNPGRRLAARRARGARASSASAATRPTPTAPGSRRRSRASARRCSTCSRAAEGGSSSPRSPPTSTGSSR